MNLLTTMYSLQFKSFEIYLAGCREHPCKGCFNQETWDENQGDTLTPELIDQKIDGKLSMIDKIWILGGEPLEKPVEEIIDLLKYLKKYNKPIWLFTRFKLKEINNRIKDELDYIKTGMYLQNKPGKKIRYNVSLGSINQEIYKKVKDKWITDVVTN